MDTPFHDLMHEVTRLTREGRLDEATRTIRRALAATTPGGGGSTPAGEVLDGLVTEVPPDREDTPDRSDGPAPTRPVPPPGTGTATPATDIVRGRQALGSMARDYRLLVPHGASGQGRPLVVLLHGCTQDADDFAVGTRIDDRAREDGFLVLSPEQSQSANPQRCWNWFKRQHQGRGRGEAALIAAMTRTVMQAHGVDPSRVYVAGLSAGGAMAALVAALHPDLFAAAGIHAGLAPGIATDLPSALAAMKGEAAGGPGPAGAGAGDGLPLDVPTVVFHGDRDTTVHPGNGDRIVERVVRGRGSAGRTAVTTGLGGDGRRYTRTVHAGDGVHPDAELWRLHGAGHAWAGGSLAGSHTDPRGIDATGEMLRFFREHPRAGSPPA